MGARGRRERDEVGPGWLSTLAGAALLLVLGFGVGLLAGAAWEEPDLVMDHLAGRATEHRLAAESPADPPPAEEPRPPVRPLGARERPPVAARPEVRVDLPLVSAAPPPAPAETQEKDGFAIQVGAFGEESAAEQLADELRASGFSVHVLEGDGTGGLRFRVRVGPVADREEATRLANELKVDHQLPTWILSPESR
jgi:cell division septation protein DedD